jgi:hypothetical protein
MVTFQVFVIGVINNYSYEFFKRLLHFLPLLTHNIRILSIFERRSRHWQTTFSNGSFMPTLSISTQPKHTLHRCCLYNSTFVVRDEGSIASLCASKGVSYIAGSTLKRDARIKMNYYQRCSRSKWIYHNCFCIMSLLRNLLRKFSLIASPVVALSKPEIFPFQHQKRNFESRNCLCKIFEWK